MSEFAPGNLDEMQSDTLEKWKVHLAGLLDMGVKAAADEAPGLERTWFFNAVSEGEGAADRLNVNWTAYPKLLSSTQTDYEQADRMRARQEEYCEWAVRTENGRPVEMIFTTETPDYYNFLFMHDKALLLSLYHRFIGEHVTIEDLTSDQGNYNVKNKYNLPVSADGLGQIVHMGGNSANFYLAAIVLAAQASWPSVDRDGNLITDEQGLIACRRFGVAHRHSDPFIGGQINQQVRLRKSVSLGGAPSLYIDSVNFADILMPDGGSPVGLFTVERGDENHIMRLRVAPADGATYALEDVLVRGQPLRFGSQIAEILRIRVTALARPDAEGAPNTPCVGAIPLGASIQHSDQTLPTRFD